MEEPSIISHLVTFGQIGGLIVVVVLFLKHMREERTDRKEALAARDAEVSKTIESNTKVITECATVIGQSAKVIEQNSAALQRFNERYYGNERRSERHNNRAAGGD